MVLIAQQVHLPKILLFTISCYSFKPAEDKLSSHWFPRLSSRSTVLFPLK